jgi:hypothetical protein
MSDFGETFKEDFPTCPYCGWSCFEFLDFIDLDESGCWKKVQCEECDEMFLAVMELHFSSKKGSKSDGKVSKETNSC